MITSLTRHERGGRSQAQPFNLLVGLGFFFNIQIMPGYIGFRLVIVVIRYKIFHRVFGEEFFEFSIELRRQGLVVGHHQRRAVHPLDDIGHGKGLARGSGAQENLVAVPLLDAGDQFLNRFGLVAGRLVWRYKFEIHN